MRDDFSEDVKRAIAARVGNHCSNPECDKQTSGPQIDPTKALNIGVAAHITAASPGGPRYDSRLTPKERRHATNAIWLCQNCAKLIDNDPRRFPVEELHQWKKQAEAAALDRLVKSTATITTYSTLEVKSSSDVADQLARSQHSRFRWIRRYPFHDIDKIPIGDALPLYASENIGVAEEFQRLPIADLVERHRASMLVGEPGAGKSTALQQRVHDHAEAYLAGAHSLPPLYVDLKWWTTGLQSLLDATVRDLCPDIDAATLSQFMLTAPIVYYLDSFDEAQNPEHLLREIKELVSRNQESRFLIASRPNQLLGSLNFTPYELAPLNRSQINEILNLYLAQYLDAEQIWQIYEDIKQYGLFAELGNPMMLWFFSLAVRDAGSVGQVGFAGKGKVFSLVVERYFLQTWEPKSLKPWAAMSRRYTSIKIDLLANIARKMVEGNDKIIVPEQWVFEEFVMHLEGKYPNTSELAHELLDQIFCHHLLERNAEHLAFWHKSLRNFFAARSLARETTPLRLDSFMYKAQWHEPLIMLASLDSRFGGIINDLAHANPILALDCIIFSQLSQDSAIVELVIHTALQAFLSKRPLEERVQIIQRLAVLYRRVPELSRTVIYSFLYDKTQADLRLKYESLIAESPIFTKATQKLESKLSEAGIEAKIEARIKTFASLARQASKRDVKNMSDVFGIRVITRNETRYCYGGLGVVHTLWQPIPGFFKDYVATPKSNVYRALHTSVLISKNIIMEVIIQTEEMHELSRQTYVSYLDSKYSDALIELEKRQTAVGVQMVPVQSHIYGERRIAVFTPHDDIVMLDEDATVLDCAHRIHSDIFNHCQGAIVNGRMVHLGHPLKNLDHVKILVDPEVRPDGKWASFLRSTSARKALGRILRQRERDEALSSGRKLVNAHIKDIVVKTGEPTDSVIKRVMRRLGCHKFEDFCRGVARGKYDLDGLHKIPRQPNS